MLTHKKKSIVLLHGSFADLGLNDLKGHDHDFFIMEGRPGLESALNTSKCLLKLKIKPTLIADNMAGFLFFRDLVKEVRVAYQYCDATGALCEIGALILGVLGKRHKVSVQLYPGKTTTRFLGDPHDILKFQSKIIAPEETKGYVPLVEWLSKKYISRVHDD